MVTINRFVIFMLAFIYIILYIYIIYSFIMVYNRQLKVSASLPSLASLILLAKQNGKSRAVVLQAFQCKYTNVKCYL